jgi:hypothetical protein
LQQSDVISFHNYGKPEEFEKRILWLRNYRRPILCTEYNAAEVFRTDGQATDRNRNLARVPR